jgi:hypothetical protein
MFRDRSDLLRDNPAQLNYGVAVTDVDGDGEYEFFVASYNAGNLVLKWDGERYTDIADDILADVERQAIGVAAGDLNGDGREEIYILNTDTFSGRKQLADRLFQWHRGRWRDMFMLPENRDALNLTAGRSVACIGSVRNRTLQLHRRQLWRPDALLRTGSERFSGRCRPLYRPRLHYGRAQPDLASSGFGTHGCLCRQ